MKILTTEKFDYITYAEITKITVKSSEIKPPPPMVIGVDPGSVNLGIAMVWNNYIVLYQVKLRNEHAVQRIVDTRYVFMDTLQRIDIGSKAVIEGASFGHAYRQVELAEVRASAILWLWDHSATVSVETPLTIRKEVFGSAKIKAETVWSDLPGDAASALACACFAAKIKIPISSEN